MRTLRAELNELDLVTIGVLDEGDDRAAVLHRPGLARHLAAALLDVLTGLVGVVHFKRDVAEGVAEFVFADTPVVGQLDHGVFGFRTVTDEGRVNFPSG